MLEPTILYAAFSYVFEWSSIDRRAHEALCPANKCNENSRTNALYDFANAYGVLRNFPRNQQELEQNAAQPWQRLRDAARLLDKVDFGQDRVTAYNKFHSKLLEKYPGNAKWSAASKFLWIRYQHDFRIYDQNAERALRRLKFLVGDGGDDWYGNYCEAWDSAHKKYRSKIQEVVGSFTLADVSRHFVLTEDEEKDITALLKAPWFKVRIFDHYLYWYGAYLRK